MTKSRVLALSAAVAACGSFLGTSALAAPVTYQPVVTADNPYVFYRLNETGGTTAEDSSINNRDGTYVGTPVFGAAGHGVGSDNAVSFTGDDYLSSPVSGFGSQMGTSSYEFLFKVNDPTSTALTSLFGTFNSVDTQAVDIRLNSNANDAVGAERTGRTRFYVRGADGDSAAIALTNAALYDGQYHHLVFTFDQSQTGADAFSAYLDGIEQEVLFGSTGTTATDADPDPDGFGAFGFDPYFAARNVRGALNTPSNVTIDEAVLYNTVLTAEQVAANATAAGFVVPEPGSLALVGLAGLGMLARRRRA